MIADKLWAIEQREGKIVSSTISDEKDKQTSEKLIRNGEKRDVRKLEVPQALRTKELHDYFMENDKSEKTPKKKVIYCEDRLAGNTD